MAFKRSEGRQLHPIVELSDGESIIARVVEVRTIGGAFPGEIVDCETIGGIPFSLNGHSVMVDKVKEQADHEGAIFWLARDGKVGRAYQYEVQIWEGSAASLREDKEALPLVDNTEKLIPAKIEALPPRD